MSMLIVIEHLEPILSRWLVIEYQHAAQLVGDKLLITNICNEEDIEILSRITKTTCRSAAELFERAIVLDPSADTLLSPNDIELTNVFIIGGILGDHPPRGRTKELLTKRLKNPIARSLGDGQYSIDGAVYVTYKVIVEGKQLNDIPYIDGIKISMRKGIYEHEIMLPFRYPLIDNKPLIHPELIKYLKGKIVLDEYKLIKRLNNEE